MKNNTKKLNDLRSAKIEKKDLRNVKGGSDCIPTETAEVIVIDDVMF